MALEVRDARPADARAVAGLLAEVGHPATTDRVAQRIARIQADPLARAFVAVLDGELVGVAAVHALWPLQRDEPVCRLTLLAVRSDRRRRGVGSALVHAVLREATARGAAWLDAVAAPEHEGAERFYQTVGFSEAARHVLLRLSEA
jgi:GNAT superfamily N-acetyltransferase